MSRHEHYKYRGARDTQSYKYSDDTSAANDTSTERLRLTKGYRYREVSGDRYGSSRKGLVEQRRSKPVQRGGGHTKDTDTGEQQGIVLEGTAGRGWLSSRYRGGTTLFAGEGLHSSLRSFHVRKGE